MPKPYYKNPRKISDNQLADLETWLDEFGDLSGIVHDLNSDQIIGGNQRSKVFNINECEIVASPEQPPDRQGTVSTGYVLWRGHKYAYRAVRWTAEQSQRANVIANKAGGEWDIDVLLSEFDTAVLEQSGFSAGELDALLVKIAAGMGEPNDPYAEWQGMPEFQQEDLTAFRSIHVHFKDREAVDNFAELIGQKVGEGMRALWYPQAEKINMLDYYDSE